MTLAKKSSKPKYFGPCVWELSSSVKVSVNNEGSQCIKKIVTVNDVTRIEDPEQFVHK